MGTESRSLAPLLAVWSIFVLIVSRLVEARVMANTPAVMPRSMMGLQKWRTIFLAVEKPKRAAATVTADSGLGAIKAENRPIVSTVWA